MARGKLTPQEIEIRKTIHSNLVKLLNAKGISQVDLSNHTGIPKATINGYFKGTSSPNAGNLQKISDFFGVKKSSIDPRYRTKITNMNKVKEFRKIPVLGTIACGEPITAEENIEEYREDIADTLPTGNLFYLKANGSSMSPTIPDKSYVLIREQPTVEDGEIAAVLVNGDTEATLKRVKHQNDLVLLVPDNTQFTPYVVTEQNPARILGKALRFSAELE